MPNDGNESTNKQYYSVACGKKIGIFKSWGQCHKQTNKVSGSLHAGFETIQDAVQFMLDNTSLSREVIKVYDSRGSEIPNYVMDKWNEAASTENEADDQSDVGPVEEDMDDGDVRTRYKETLIDPVLTFVIFAMNNSPMSLVANTLVQFYTAEELTFAKNKLWDCCDNIIIGQYTKRRDSTSRSVQEVLALDITGAIQKLDTVGSLPNVVVDPVGLNRIPKMIPSENNAISMCERLAAVENRMNTLEHTVSENACKSELLVQRVDNFASYSRVASGRPVPSAPRVLPSEYLLLHSVYQLLQMSVQW